MKTTEFKVPASPELVAACNEFLVEPTTALESRILMLLNECLAQHDFECEDEETSTVIEWGCIEHGVVDVFAYDGQQVIRIDPKTATVEAL